MQNASGLLFPIALLVLMYFLMIRPQQVQAKKRQAMLNSLKKGDRIVTIGGIHGTLVEFKGDDAVIVRIADKVEVSCNRTAIGAVRERDGGDS